MIVLNKNTLLALIDVGNSYCCLSIGAIKANAEYGTVGLTLYICLTNLVYRLTEKGFLNEKKLCNCDQF